MIALTGDGALDITKVPAKTRPTHWDELAADLGALLGGRWKVSKLGGYWIIFDTKQQRGSHGDFRSLANALSVATGLKIVK